MKHPFTKLTLQDVQKLRRMPMAVLATPIPYSFQMLILMPQCYTLKPYTKEE